VPLPCASLQSSSRAIGSAAQPNCSRKSTAGSMRPSHGRRAGPIDATRLSHRLRRAAPGLRKLGIGIDLDHKHPQKRRLVITVKKEPPPQASQPSHAHKINGLAAKADGMASLRGDGSAFALKAAEGSAKADEMASLRSNPLNQNDLKAAKAAKAVAEPFSSSREEEGEEVPI
jgi:hypothetical protein